MAETYQADIVVVGSGVAGALTAAKLAAGGSKVLILEAGPRVDRGEGLERFQKSRTQDDAVALCKPGACAVAGYGSAQRLLRAERADEVRGAVSAGGGWEHLALGWKRIAAASQ